MAESAAERFAGKVAVVTGAGSGIGEATARRFAREGARVLVADIDADRAKGVADDLPSARAVVGDVADESSWQQIVATAAQEFGAIDVLVNNAASWKRAPAHSLSVDDWRGQIEACLSSVYLGFRACHSELARNGGNVVNVSSVHAMVGLPGHPAYAASKGGVIALTRQLAVEYGPRIRVNAVVPGPILTAAWEGLSEADREGAIASTVAKRFGTPDEVAAAIAFLASDDASFITGAALTVDGGWSASK